MSLATRDGEKGTRMPALVRPGHDVTGVSARSPILRPQYEGRWDLWFVPRYPTGETWCARPVGAHVATINTSAPEELIEEIRKQEQDAPSGQL